MLDMENAARLLERIDTRKQEVLKSRSEFDVTLEWIEYVRRQLLAGIEVSEDAPARSATHFANAEYALMVGHIPRPGDVQNYMMGMAKVNKEPNH